MFLQKTSRKITKLKPIGKNFNTMKRLLLFIALSGTILLLSGCTGLKKTVQTPSASSYLFNQDDQYRIINNFYIQLKNWKGVPHRDGGMSKKGVDCSGFTYITFLELFDIRLPRTTSQLAHTGRPISKLQLQPGDLVFFKINMWVKHVGIYVENQKFIHASRKKGVMMSRLDTPYWQKNYWQSRRIGHQ